MSQAITNRYEFLMLFDCENGNPNGQPRQETVGEERGVLVACRHCGHCSSRLPENRASAVPWLFSGASASMVNFW